MRLHNRVAIITGSAQGIGKGIAEAMAAEGARVIVVDIDNSKGTAVAAQIPGSRFELCDVGDSVAVNTLVENVHTTYGQIDILVNNAGILRTGDVLDISEADFDAVLRVNLKGPFLLSQAVGKVMVEQGSGAIINMSSVNGKLAIPGILPYNVSKGGLDQLTRVMAVALADKGVRVNAIGPGSILTDMLEQVMADDDARRAILSRTPMGRCGTIEEIASIAVFLASDDSSYVTGECIYADGGRLGLNYTVPVRD